MKNLLRKLNFYSAYGIVFVGLALPIHTHAADLTVEVIQGKPRSLGRLEKGASKLSARLDQDGDGKLSLDELLLEHQRQVQAFHLADKNSDGHLNAAEKKVFIKSIKLKR